MRTVPRSRAFVQFRARRERPLFLGARHAALLTGSVLDVGCDEAVLRGLCGARRYVGVDRSAQADLRLDLARVKRLPFEDQSFDTVVCWDVLEHLEHPQALFAELARVAHRDVLVSLPNPWNAARKQLRRGRGTIEHYGLPLELPPDRHRWFFSLAEAEDFLGALAARHALQIVELLVLEKPRPRLVRAWRRLLHPARSHYDNLYAHTLSAHLRRTP
jgi:SAM-dependent methyltransferase